MRGAGRFAHPGKSQGRQPGALRAEREGMLLGQRLALGPISCFVTITTSGPSAKAADAAAWASYTSPEGGALAAAGTAPQAGPFASHSPAEDP